MACGFGIVQRRASVCGGLHCAGGASDVHVRGCVRVLCVGHTARWPVVALRLAGQERSPARCIVAAFAPSGQALCSTAAGVYKFIMPLLGIRNRVRVRGFFHESVRNRPLTRLWEPWQHYLPLCPLTAAAWYGSNRNIAIWNGMIYRLAGWATIWTVDSFISSQLSHVEFLWMQFISECFYIQSRIKLTCSGVHICMYFPTDYRGTADLVYWNACTHGWRWLQFVPSDPCLLCGAWSCRWRNSF